MTDLEITKLCAEAMELSTERKYWVGIGDFVYEFWNDISQERQRYDPFYNDAQVMALVKKLRLTIEPSTDGSWFVFKQNSKFFSEIHVIDIDLNRAICGCVAKMRAAK